MECSCLRCCWLGVNKFRVDFISRGIGIGEVVSEVVIAIDNLL